MIWSKLSKGASKGFDEFIKVSKGKKGIDDAMKDIKDHFENNNSLHLKK